MIQDVVTNLVMSCIFGTKAAASVGAAPHIHLACATIAEFLKKEIK